MSISGCCHFVAIIIGVFAFEMLESGQLVSRAAERALGIVYLSLLPTFFVCPILSIWAASRLPNRRFEISRAIVIELVLCAMQLNANLPSVQ